MFGMLPPRVTVRAVGVIGPVRSVLVFVAECLLRTDREVFEGFVSALRVQCAADRRAVAEVGPVWASVSIPSRSSATFGRDWIIRVFGAHWRSLGCCAFSVDNPPNHHLAVRR